MSAMSITHCRRLAVALAALLLGPACDKKEQSETESVADKGDAKAGSALDPSLAEAVAAASPGMQRGPAPAVKNGEGPPPNGVFAPGEADRQMPKSGAPKITLGGTGSPPLVDLSSAKFAVGWKRQGKIQLVIQSDPRQGALPLDFSVVAELLKPKNPEPGAAQPAGVQPGAAEPKSNVGPMTLRLRIERARVAKAGGAGELDSDLAKMTGSRIEYEIAPNGVGSGYRYELAKGANAALSDLMRSLTEVMATVTLPFPEAPIGSGGLWMATTRDDVRGLDLVSYRLTKVTGVSGQTAELELNTKRYATGVDFTMPGVEAGTKLTLDQFQSTADGSLRSEVGLPVPVEAKIALTLQAVVVPEAQPNQRLTVQAQTRATLSFAPPTTP